MNDDQNFSLIKEPPAPKLTLAERIRQRRKELDLTVEELSALTVSYDIDSETEDNKGISIASLYRYEKGEREPGAREIKLLCYAFDISPNWLLLGEEWDTRSQKDAAVADMFRALLKVAKIDNILPTKDDSRIQAHRQKLEEIKQRRAPPE